jgi:hypothetical protein
MTRKEFIRLVTAFINLNCNKTRDEFSGDYLMTLEDTDKLVTFQEKLGMQPPETIVTDPGQFFGDAFEYTANVWDTEESE